MNDLLKFPPNTIVHSSIQQPICIQVTTMVIASWDLGKPFRVLKAKLGVEGLQQINRACNYFYITGKSKARPFIFLSFKFGSIQFLAAEISSAKFYPGAPF